VANCLIFHNLCSLTRLVRNLEQRGESVPEDAIAAISHYLTEHINRFGGYTLNLDRKPPQPDYGFTLKGAHFVANRCHTRTSDATHPVIAASSDPAAAGL
jgi:hypothetical protein